MLAGLKGKWRNCLRKGIKAGLNIIISEGDNHKLISLLDRYEQLQQEKGFVGVPDALIVALANQSGDEWSVSLIYATENGKSEEKDAVGMLVSIRHGDTSTYFIGTTNQLGRKLQANYVLLWEAILHARRNSCKWFDIGGLNETTPRGIAHFKQGVNSELYSLIGEWRGLMLPWITRKVNL